MTEKNQKNRVVNRTRQRKARALAKAEGIKYTTALRRVMEEETRLSEDK